MGDGGRLYTRFNKFFLSRLSLIIVIVSIAIIATILPTIISNINNLSHSFATGVRTHTSPMPLYGFGLLDKNRSGLDSDTFAMDFSAVYFGSRNFQEPEFYEEKYDPFGRSQLYPPMVYYAYGKIIGDASFDNSVLVHLLIQVILLMTITFFILRYYNLYYLIFPIILIYLILLFLTPVGLSWFERGQFDLYPALAIMLFLFAVYESKAYAFGLSAFFASMKWTAALFFVSAFLIYLIFSDEKRKFWFFGIFSGVFALSLIVFPNYSIKYLANLSSLQGNYVEGITLVNRMPMTIIFLLPIIALIFYVIFLFLTKDRKYIFLNTFLPFMSGIAVFGLLMPSITWEYRLVSFIGFIAMAFVWCVKYSNDRVLRTEFILTFAVFLIGGFHCFWILGISNPKMEYMILVYLAYFIAMTIFTLLRLSHGFNYKLLKTRAR